MLYGILLTSLAILTLEIVLTRVFSVFMHHHFVFLVISLALLGSGAAGVWILLAPRLFSPEKVHNRLTLLAASFGFATVASFLYFLKFPFAPSMLYKEGFTLSATGSMALTYAILALPFLFGGGTIALAIHQFSGSVGRVYFFDLLGAGLGCLVSIVALNSIGASDAVLLVGVLASAAALCFAMRGGLHSRWIAGMSLTLLGALLLLDLGAGWLRVPGNTHQGMHPEILHEKWNAMSRITVHPRKPNASAFGWGYSPKYKGTPAGDVLLLIDHRAGTPIHRWNNSLDELEFLEYDITSMAYRLLSEPDVFIIGAGGGRDLLTGLRFGARSVRSAELNPAIAGLLRSEYAEHSGHVYDHPKVHVVIEDARTYLSRIDAEFDLIQASLIDTWAASSAGAYALSENGLYTREAFLTYYRRLKPGGMVNFSRWYHPKGPMETLRMVTLGLDSWRHAGVDDPTACLILLTNRSTQAGEPTGTATMLLKKTPFTSGEVDTIVAESDRLAFNVFYAPGYDAKSNPVDDLVSAPELSAVIDAYPRNISVTTDNRPYFFNFVRFRDLLDAEARESFGFHRRSQANVTLLSLFFLSIFFAGVFIISPLVVARGRSLSLRSSWPYLAFYAAIGLGFMLVMIPTIQRLTIYVGSPIYALSLVLFTILIGGGLGSLTTQNVPRAGVGRRLRTVILGLVALIAIELFLVPIVTGMTQALPFFARGAIVIALVLPLGLLMGQPFPLGIKWIRESRPELVPWLWAVNGATSVSGSALAAVLALGLGFRAVLLGGLICYALALGVATVGWALASSGPSAYAHRESAASQPAAG